VKVSALEVKAVVAVFGSHGDGEPPFGAKVIGGIRRVPVVGSEVPAGDMTGRGPEFPGAFDRDADRGLDSDGSVMMSVHSDHF